MKIVVFFRHEYQGIPFMNYNNTQDFLAEVLPFLESIAIPYTIQPIEFKTFLPGVGLEDGKLWIDTGALLYPGDILHEAGHYAVTESLSRQGLNQQTIASNTQIDGEEMCAMLWSFAVAKHLSIPLEIVFHKDGYKGQSAWLLEQYGQGNYIGLPLLQWFGMLYEEGEGPGFPILKHWLRP